MAMGVNETARIKATEVYQVILYMERVLRKVKKVQNLRRIVSLKQQTVLEGQEVFRHPSYTETIIPNV